MHSLPTSHDNHSLPYQVATLLSCLESPVATRLKTETFVTLHGKTDTNAFPFKLQNRLLRLYPFKRFMKAFKRFAYPFKKICIRLTL